MSNGPSSCVQALVVFALCILASGCGGPGGCDTAGDSCPAPKDTGAETADTDTGADVDPDAIPVAVVDVQSGGVQLTITDGSGPYRFGMAWVNFSTPSWTGEDCYLGAEDGTSVCHPMDETGGFLPHVRAEADLTESTTLIYSAMTDISFYLENASGRCWVWEDSDRWYEKLGCDAMAVPDKP